MKGWITFLSLLAVTSVAAEGDKDHPDLAMAITSGDASLGIRYRYEQVDQDGFDEKAQASTARLRFNYKTGRWKNWSGVFEFDHVFDVLLTDFNSGGGTSPNKDDYPVVADPDGSDLNQLYLDYSSGPDWKWRFGRQRILLDKQRFVGGVGWRQNEQTYDAVSLTTTAVRNTTLFYSYVGQVRRIFGQTVSAGRNNVDTHLLNAKIKIDDNWTVSPYAYYIDNKDVLAFSTSTIGARIAGDVSAGKGKISLLGEFATQSDIADAPIDFDADYVHLAVTWSNDNGFSIGTGFESLGGSSDPGKAFRTPLATLHAFNGWADKFLATPDAGLDDTYLTVKFSAGDWLLSGVYHDFSEETGRGDFGREFDVRAARNITNDYRLMFKGAFFSADSNTTLTDTNKFWIVFTAHY